MAGKDRRVDFLQAPSEESVSESSVDDHSRIDSFEEFLPDSSVVPQITLSARAEQLIAELNRLAASASAPSTSSASMSPSSSSSSLSSSSSDLQRPSSPRSLSTSEPSSSSQSSPVSTSPQSTSLSPTLQTPSRSYDNIAVLTGSSSASELLQSQQRGSSGRLEIASCQFQRMEALVQRLEARRWRDKVLKNRTWRFRKYPNCATGKGLVKYFLSVGEAKDAAEAVSLGRSLLRAGFLAHVVQEHDFENEHLFYNVFSVEERDARRAQLVRKISSPSLLLASGETADAMTLRVTLAELLELCRSESVRSSAPLHISCASQRITDADLEQFLRLYTERRLDFMTQLDISDNPTLTPAALGTLVDFLSRDLSLRRLVLVGNGGFTKSACAKFVKQLWSVNFTLTALAFDKKLEPDVQRAVELLEITNRHIAKTLARPGPKSLSMESRRIAQAPAAFVASLATLPSRGAVTTLNLSNNQLTASIFEALLPLSTSLQQLQLGGNKIEAVPPSVADFYELRHLDLSNNNLHAVPPYFGPSLETLNLLGNRKLSVDATLRSLVLLPRLRVLLLRDGDSAEALTARAATRATACRLLPVKFFGVSTPLRWALKAAAISRLVDRDHFEVLSSSYDVVSSVSASATAATTATATATATEPIQSTLLGDRDPNNQGMPARLLSIVDFHVRLTALHRFFAAPNGVYVVFLEAARSLRHLMRRLRLWLGYVVRLQKYGAPARIVILLLGPDKSSLSRDDLDARLALSNRIAKSFRFAPSVELRTLFVPTLLDNVEQFKDLLLQPPTAPPLSPSTSQLLTSSLSSSSLPPAPVAGSNATWGLSVPQTYPALLDRLNALHDVEVFSLSSLLHLAHAFELPVGWTLVLFFEQAGRFIFHRRSARSIEAAVSLNWLFRSVLPNLQLLPRIASVKNFAHLAVEPLLLRKHVLPVLTDMTVLIKLPTTPPELEGFTVFMSSHAAPLFISLTHERLADASMTAVHRRSTGWAYARAYQFNWLTETTLGWTVRKLLKSPPLCPGASPLLCTSCSQAWVDLAFFFNGLRVVVGLGVQSELSILHVKLTACPPQLLFAVVFALDCLLQSSGYAAQRSYLACACSTSVTKLSDAVFSVISTTADNNNDDEGPSSPQLSPRLHARLHTRLSSTSSTSSSSSVGSRSDSFFADSTDHHHHHHHTALSSSMPAIVHAPLASLSSSSSAVASSSPALMPGGRSTSPGVKFPRPMLASLPLVTSPKFAPRVRSFSMANSTIVSSLSEEEITVVLQRNLSIRDRSYRLKVYKNCFVASEAISVLQQLTDGAMTRAAAISLFQRLIDRKIITHVVDANKRFADEYLFFRFTSGAFVAEIDLKQYDLEALLAAAKAELRIEDVGQGKETVSSCFTGASAVRWLCKREEIPSAEADRLFQKLVERGDIEAAADSSLPFVSNDTLFRFAQESIPKINENTDQYNLFAASKIDLLLSENAADVPCPLCAADVPLAELCPDLAYLGQLPTFDPTRLSDPVLLGSGAFAQVYRSTYAFDDDGQATPVVLKQYDLGAGSLRAYNFAKLRLECWVLSQAAPCPHIISLHGVSWSGDRLSVLLELMADGDLYNFIRRTEPGAVSMATRLSMAEQVAQGMRYLHHQLKIIHNDLKSPNVLVSCVDGDCVRAKICDFDQSQSGGFAGKLPRQWKVENPIWSPPEHEPVSFKTDVYSFAIVLWELANWSEPFRELKFMAQIAALVASGVRPRFADDAVDKIPTAVVALIQSCWATEPQERPTFEHVCQALLRVQTAGSPPPPDSR